MDTIIPTLDKTDALNMLAMTDMNPFTEMDWMAFSGCETKNPTIGYHDSWILILDGDILSVIHEDDSFGGQIFEI